MPIYLITIDGDTSDRNNMLLVTDPLIAALCVRMTAGQTGGGRDTLVNILAHAGCEFSVASEWPSDVWGDVSMSWEWLEHPQARPARVTRGHVWCDDDYTMYICRLRYFLQSPRGAQALRSGGIVAYIASTLIDMHLASNPPDCGQDGDSFPRIRTISGLRDVAIDCYEDRLTEDEMGIVCGMYLAVDEEADDKTPVYYSYWPLQDVWNRSRYGVGYWTPWAQKFATERAASLFVHPVPIQQGDWNILLGKQRGPAKSLDQVMRTATVSALDG